MKILSFFLVLLFLALPASAAEVELQIMQNSARGPYLADSSGRALYVYGRDTRNVSACMGRCKARWIPLKAGSAAGPGLKESDFSSFTHVQGTQQLTFRGAPLYYYAQDRKPGDVNGHGQGGQWSLVNPESFAGYK